ncbi:MULTISPECIES: biotin-dependent carboxyltransferase family protein [unclassified Microbacterium]|uniref:5-oxoprolinase subunit C family protein n=1 Tax=unclassified Microbacterium TaxID=2609290 RepID=UPI000CFBA225|nr:MULTISPECIES: biotin-dependent carboxyltransferase family protein [unclassified Microbacterium]PQZ60107.1 allophanate hydrolase [Microbacterium sp. MYb43]PQZ79547.1 allophanate hydrolase [Microbacterium sp. MYb40]PRB23150.1 allophanate hydrolase [Microbacterium sp. MYb54]PRB27573.1 allophanate hydrolase [Microbacterium sp. MYb50]PRB65864.1 allophanate hydrolase [Microbacterium sp. MYb24]
MLEVVQPGLQTTVQDEGRQGYYSLGFPQGGSMDQESARFANALVGNPASAAVLECTYIGPVLRATEPVVVAVAGAPVPVLVNGEPRDEWSRLALEAGDTLSFGVIGAGTKFWIAVRGGIDVPVVLGSRSTYVIGAIGGVGGRAAAAGDELPVGVALQPLPPVASLAPQYRPVFERTLAVRVVLGLYDHLLTEEGVRRLVEEEWTLTPMADRMGLRFDGPGVEWRERDQPFGAGQDPSNIVDAGYAVGSIQIPGGTQPIVLHRDAVSGGGYAMVATVISADMDLLARAAPGVKVRFLPVSMDEALIARGERRRRILAAVESLGGL